MNTLSIPTFVLALIKIAVAGTAFADTRETCESALHGMGYTLGAYVHQPSGIFSREQHIFGSISCTVNFDGTIRSIERGNEVIAEDGIFGPSAIRFRHEAERLHSIIVAEARSERDAAIEAARGVFQREQQARRDKYSEIENIAQAQLNSLISQLREGLVDIEAANYLGIDAMIREKLIADSVFKGFHETLGSEQAQRNSEEATQYDEPLSVSQVTELSRQASRLRLGLSMCEVISMLGDPTWIIWNGEDPETEPFDVLLWENGSCFPVVSDFDGGVLVGWNEGRSMCGLDASTLDLAHPAGQFRTSTDRNVNCQ